MQLHQPLQLQFLPIKSALLAAALLVLDLNLFSNGPAPEAQTANKSAAAAPSPFPQWTQTDHRRQFPLGISHVADSRLSIISDPNSPLPEASAAISEANDNAHTLRQHLSALERPDFEVTTVYINPRAQSRAESNDVLRRIRSELNDDPGDDYTRRYPILLLRVRQSQDFHESRSS